MKKILTLLSCERLAKYRDGEMDLILYSITKEDESQSVGLQKDSIRAIKVGISGSLLNVWENQDNSFSLKENLDNELMCYGLEQLRDRILSGKDIEKEEEFFLTSYSKYKPKGPGGIKVIHGHKEVIEVKGKLGFV